MQAAAAKIARVAKERADHDLEVLLWANQRHVQAAAAKIAHIAKKRAEGGLEVLLAK